MNTVTIHTKSKKDLEMIIALAKRLNAVVDDPVEEDSPYNSKFVAKIRKSEKQIEQGKVTEVDADNIWESML